MTQATYGGVLSLAAGAFLLFAVLIVCAVSSARSSSCWPGKA